jgi:beta-fructofuranosidase
MHWGHASSPDLVHWQHLPIALAPTPGGPDHDGVWSGCAINWDSHPGVVYTGRDGESERVCLAASLDGLRTWQKYAGNPVIYAPPADLDQVGFRDPCVWRAGEGWLMAIGSGIRDVGGAVLLYSSPDLTHWQYLGPLIAGDKNQKEPVWTGEMWECPNFFPLGNRHVLIISPMDLHPSRSLYTIYFTGAFRDNRFTPQVCAKMDGGDIFFYAPQAFLDESGRRIIIGWSREARSIAAQEAAGWAGVMTLPRLLELRSDGRMSQRPVPEIEMLRGEKRSWNKLRIGATGVGRKQMDLDGLCGDTLEMAVDFNLSDAGEGKEGVFGLLVRLSPDGKEQTEIRYEPASGRLMVDTRRSSLSMDVEPGRYEIPLDFSGLDQLHLRIFLDRSIIEVYANDLAVITARVYPSWEDSTGIALFAEDCPVFIERLDAWQMQPVW